MKLPNHEEAVVPKEKITLYLLNMQHPKGGGKAIFFMRFGFSSERWEQLANALFTHAQMHEVAKIEQTVFGRRYIIEGVLETPSTREPLVRVVWFISKGHTRPHLVSAYPLEHADD